MKKLGVVTVAIVTIVALCNIVVAQYQAIAHPGATSEGNTGAILDVTVGAVPHEATHQPGATSGGSEKPYAGLGPEEITVYKYRDQPGEWARIYIFVKDPKGCSGDGSGITTREISMFLYVPSGFEIRWSTEPTIFHREIGSGRVWVDFSEVFKGDCCREDYEGYYARDWFEIRPLSDVSKGSYSIRLSWIAHYIDASGMSQTNSGESVVKVNVVELTPPELKKSASDAIDDAKDSITLAEVYIKNNLQRADMSNAVILLNQAKDYLEEAEKYYDNGEFDIAKTKALKAKSLAEEAKSVAEEAVKLAEKKAQEARIQMMYYAIGIVLVILIALGFVLYRKRRLLRKDSKEH